MARSVSRGYGCDYCFSENTSWRLFSVFVHINGCCGVKKQTQTYSLEDMDKIDADPTFICTFSAIFFFTFRVVPHSKSSTADLARQDQAGYFERSLRIAANLNTAKSSMTTCVHSSSDHVLTVRLQHICKDGRCSYTYLMRNQTACRLITENIIMLSFLPI